MITNKEIRDRFASLTTAHVADGCIRTTVPLRCAPADTEPVTPGHRVAGRVCPARHVGSVDIFLEVLENADEGDVLVVDNGGRADEACVGDLVVLEAQEAGLAGLVIWGQHRDTAEIRSIGLPVFSLGATPAGPQRLDPRPDDALTAANFGEWTVGRDDVVLADQDGVVFVPHGRIANVFEAAEAIRDTEQHQADRMRGGTSLRDQVSFALYLQRRRRDPSYTFRQHLAAMKGAIEV